MVTSSNEMKLEESKNFISKESEMDREWQWAFPQIEGVPPTSRGGHTGTLSGASLIIFGGHQQAGSDKGFVQLNDTLVLDVNGNRWIQPKLSGTAPTPRQDHTAVLAGSRIIIFGGRGPNETHLRDLHALDPLHMTWQQGPEGGGAPPGRCGHSATLVGGNRMFVFGGKNSKTFFGDLHVLDLEVMAWSLLQTTGPIASPRSGHVALLIGTNLIIQGGFYFDETKVGSNLKSMGTGLKNCQLNDLRVLDTSTLTWSRLRVSGTPPIPRFGHTLNLSGSDLIMFGGWSRFSGDRSKKDWQPEGESDYFFILDTQTMSWKKGKQQAGAPSCRQGHISISIGPHLLIFGGWDQSKAINEVIVLRDCSAITGIDVPDENINK